MENGITEVVDGAVDHGAADRADVSAEHEQPELAKTDKLGRKNGNHTHGANFGRYVEGCPACEKKMARGGFKATKRTTQIVKHVIEQAQPQSATTSTAFTPEQLQQLMQLQSMNGGNLVEALKAFAQELKAPSKEEQETKEAAAQRRQQQRDRAIEAARAAEQGKLAREATCEQLGHKKDEGRSTKSAIVQGQVYNDGYIRPFCLTCGKQFTPIKATVADMTMTAV